MDESEFNMRAEAAMGRIEAGLDGLSLDIDFFRPASGLLEIECDAARRIVVNRHDATQEIWVAAHTGGFHYRWDGTVWRNTRGGGELLADLSALLAAQTGAPVSLD